MAGFLVYMTPAAFKLMICIPVYIALGILFSRIARKIAIKNDEKNDEDDRGEKI